MPSPRPTEQADELTLTETAELLGVHYMTAYRYVRIGKLDGRKEGRDWRIDRADVEALRDAGRPTRPGQSGPSVDRSQLLLDRLLAFDERGAWSVIESALVSGHDPIEVHTGIVGPAMSEVGERWVSGRLAIARQHGATTICRSLVGRLSLISSRPGRSKGTVVFACAPGDSHDLPLTIAADIFRASGFDVVDCGADLPADAFADLVATVDNLAAVGIGMTMPGNEVAVRAMITGIRARRPEVTVLLGGSAAAELASAEVVGADHVVATALDGVAVLVDD